MARKKRTQAGNAESLGNVTDYRHEGATRVNIPPAKIAAEGAIPKVSEAQYSYSPRRSPTLRFDQRGTPDALLELLEQARQRSLTDEEARRLAEVGQWADADSGSQRVRGRADPGEARGGQAMGDSREQRGATREVEAPYMSEPADVG